MAPFGGVDSALTQVVSVFLAGVGTSLTPCIYPLIPVTLAVFGATADAGGWRGFRLALTYVLGIAAMYTTLGLFSAKTGAVFGALLGDPTVIGGLVAVLVVLALYTLDLVPLGSVGALQNLAAKIGGRGYRGAFLMGTVSGLVAAPCAGPALVVILGIAAAAGSTAWGAVLLFSYALGLGLLFIVLGTFPSLLGRLPRSGAWLIGVKFLMAAAILAVAFYLAAPLAGAALRFDLAASAPWLTLGLALAAGGLALWSIRRDRALGKFCAAVLLAWSVTAGVTARTTPLGSVGDARTWIPTLDGALAEAKRTGAIALVDLYADWCAACKELEHQTFPAPSVAEALTNFVTARIDFTTETPLSADLAARYNVVGLPCILFLDGEGRELPDTRVTGFMGPAEFRAHLDAVRARAAPAH